MGGSTEARLAELAHCRAQGLLSEKEYKRARRRAIRGLDDAGTRSGHRIGIILSLLIASLVFTGAIVAGTFARMSAGPRHTAATQHLALTEASSSQVQTAISWAKQYLGSNYDDGLCLTFVHWAYEAAGIQIGYADYPPAYWTSDPEGWVENSSPGVYNNPPAGALLFWGPNQWSSTGHVALSLGNNSVISTAAYPYADGNSNDPDVFEFSLSQRSASTYHYLGYIMPLDSPAPPPPPPTTTTTAPTTTTTVPPTTTTTEPASHPTPTSPPTTSSTGGHGGSVSPGPSKPNTPATTSPGSTAPSTTTTTTAVTGPPPPPPPTTYAETVGGVTNTWTNYTNAGGYEGNQIPQYATVQITCRLQGFAVADGNVWWYKIASGPWSNNFYASADAFYNNGATSGSLQGTPFFDPAVPIC